MKDITVQELKAKMDAGEKFSFIDVREPFEYEEFNLGAQLIPLGQLHGKIPDLGIDREEEIVIHCKMGGRSKVGKDLLERAGFKNVRNLIGGVEAWKKEYGS